MAERKDFVRTCINNEAADCKIENVLDEYKDDPSWEIGKSYKNNLSDGYVQAIVELTKLTKEDLERKKAQLQREDNYRPRM